MKILALGKICQNKFCNLSGGTVFSFLNEHLEVGSDVFIKVVEDNPDISYALNLKTGTVLRNFHTSVRCKIYPDAAVVLDPIDRS